jgi:hypothetical protein
MPDQVYRLARKRDETTGTISRSTAVPWTAPNQSTPQCMQEVSDVIQPRAFVPPLDPSDDLHAVQAPGQARIIAARLLPTQPVRPVCGNRDSFVRPGPVPSRQCCAPREERKTQIITCADMGFSAMLETV